MLKRRLAVATFAQVFIGLGVALVVRAGLGVDPWTSFTQGASHLTQLSIGRTSQLITCVLLIVNYFLGGEIPGWGTLLNGILVGQFIDVFLPLVQAPGALFLRWVFLFGGILSMALGISAYISTNLGKGPTEGWAFTISKLLRLNIGSAKMIADALALLIGVLLGGKIGVGTLIAALTLGPLLRLFLSMMRFGPDASTAPLAQVGK
jgi:uncharacterized membrane protein YczE